jgi:hypothetical protein
MKTEVIMKRELFGEEISQKSKSEFFSATDLIRAGNKWRVGNGLEIFIFSNWLQNKNTKEFMNFLSEEYGIIKINSKGKNQHTWVHPFLFIKIALALNPKLEIKVYKWIYDELLKYRNNSGDSYKKMAGALFLNSKNKTCFYKEISLVAEKIKLECAVNDWQTAKEAQLKLRDKMHENISLLADVLRDNDQAVRIGIEKAKEESK